MTDASDLDQVLQEIQSEAPKSPAGTYIGPTDASSAGVGDLATHLASRPTAAPTLYAAEEINASRPAEEVSTARLLASGLSERQRRLPKIDFRMVGGVLAVLILIVGVGSATILTGESQELRQRAFQAIPTVTPLPEFELTATPLPVPVVEPAEAKLSPSVALILGGLGLVLVIGLVAFLFWSFVV